MIRPTPQHASLTRNEIPQALAAAYARCREIARKRAGNFYLSFLTLPAPQRSAMCALYAFMRAVDDQGDGDASGAEKRVELARWRERIDGLIDADLSRMEWWPAFADAMYRFDIPKGALHAVIDGVASDLETTRYATFADLYHYCYQVASSVGLACIAIWDVKDERAALLAEWCGVAMQLTNVLRDVAEDFALGRVYIPQEDLKRFGVDEAVLGSKQPTEPFVSMMRFQIERAEDYFRRARDLECMLDPPARAMFRVITGVYRALLAKIARDPGRVLSRRVSLPFVAKAGLLLRSFPLRWSATSRLPEREFEDEESL